MENYLSNMKNMSRDNQLTSLRNVIAIDGPAGAGKSTVAREVAHRVRYVYLDTGAMYRALTVKALQERVDLMEEAALAQLAARTDIELRPGTLSDDRVRLFVDQKEVTDALRTPEVNRAVSYVAQSPAVRHYMVERQRLLASAGQVVAEGRDIASNVLPEAGHKIFLTASLEERARRRWIELKAAGYEVPQEEVQNDLRQRDKIDSERKVAPLVRVPDAYVIDSSCLTIEEVVDKVVEYCKRGGLSAIRPG